MLDHLDISVAVSGLRGLSNEVAQSAPLRIGGRLTVGVADD